MRVPIVARLYDGLKSCGGGAVGRTVGASRARRATWVLAAVGVVVARTAHAVRPARRARQRHRELGARLARALVGLASHVVVRVPRAGDGLAGGAPEAEKAWRALRRVPQTRAVSHRARTARRRRGGADFTKVVLGTDRALGLVFFSRVRAFRVRVRVRARVRVGLGLGLGLGLRREFGLG